MRMESAICTPGCPDLTGRKETNMQDKLIWKYDLTLFDGDGGAGAGAAVGGEGVSGSDTGVNAGDAVPTNPNRRNRKQNPLANVRYGRQEAAQAAAQETPQEQQTDPDSEWKAAKEKFKDKFNADTTAIVQERLRNSKQAEATLGKLAPVFEGLGKKYGKEASDIDGIIAAYTDDDSLYEDEAAAAGMPVSAYKQLKALEADKAQRDAREAQTMQEQQFQQHIQGLIAQGDKLKLTFPDFDLRTELQNPTFQRLTSPEVGIDVETAYWTIHRDELNMRLAQSAVQTTSRKLSQSIQSGITRPAENGSRNVSPALDIRDDPSKWSRADREEVKRRVRNGERVIL